MKNAATKNRAGPRKKDKHYSYDESVDEAGKTIDAEAVEIEAEVPAEENQSVESLEPDDNPAPNFEE
ncbi:MAG TPA: hypothetical protein VEQ35_05880 [Beijerinckia sp.]|jgi:hypothetical protein|nr:hypothetical protein [Beijerinckia sp.]